MYSKLVLFLAATVTAVVATPAKLGNRGRQSFGASSFSRRTLGGQNNAPNLIGAYSFNFETPNGIKRKEEGKPQEITGAVAKNGEWSHTFPDGTRRLFKFVADEKGYRVDEKDITAKTPEELRKERIQAALEKTQAALAEARERAAESRRRASFARPDTPYSGPLQGAASSGVSSRLGAGSVQGNSFGRPSSAGPSSRSAGGHSSNPSAPTQLYGVPA